MELCNQFIINNTCSSGRCICGREKWEHSKKKQYEHIFYDEGMKRASQHNFNQAEAGYNAKWFKRGAVFGAKWQQERSYSEEEVIQLMDNFRNSYETDLIKWFNLNKK